MTCLTACLTFIFGTESGASSATPSERCQNTVKLIQRRRRQRDDERGEFYPQKLEWDCPILDLKFSHSERRHGHGRRPKTSFGLILSIFAQQLLTAESAWLLTSWVILMWRHEEVGCVQSKQLLEKSSLLFPGWISETITDFQRRSCAHVEVRPWKRVSQKPAQQTQPVYV